MAEHSTVSRIGWSKRRPISVRGGAGSHVEGRVMGHQHAALGEGVEPRHRLGHAGGVRDHFVGDVVNGGGGGGDLAARD
jgi:hypothetical protein